MAPKIGGHVCKFTKTCKTLDVLFPATSTCGKLRRKFRESLLISEENGRKCCSSRGTAEYIYEKEKQLTQHYYMIHPFSKFRQYWEITVMLEIILCLTIRPFVVSQFKAVALCDIKYQIPALFTDLFELTDISLRFMTGYIDKETRNVALETRKVFFKNIKQYNFYLNLLISLPLEYLLYSIISQFCQSVAAHYIIFLKIFKVSLLSRYLRHTAKVYNWSGLCFRIIWTIIMTYIACHWLTCLFYTLVFGTDFGPASNAFDKHESAFRRHFSLLHMTTSVIFFHNGCLPEFSILEAKDTVVASLLLITAYILNIVIVGMFIQLLGLTKTSTIQYEEMIQEVQKFLVQENLPKHVHQRVIKYFQFRFRWRYFREKIILETLSPPLRQEICNFLCMGLLLHHKSIFIGIPPEVANSLCLQMKFETFLAGDVILRAGRKAGKMYFIYCGSVVMYSAVGKELKHLYQGQQFGVSAFSTDNRYVVTVVALEMSEYYVLRHRDFLASISDYPEYKAQLTENADKQRTLLYRGEVGMSD